MGNSLKSNLQSSPTLKNIIYVLAATAVMLSGIFFLPKATSPLEKKGNQIVISSQVTHIEDNLINRTAESITNNGATHYHGNIENNGSMDCNFCSTGVNYLDNIEHKTQEISGDKLIKWHDGILDNKGGLLLKNELQLVNSFIFKSGHVTTDRTQSDAFLHFLDKAVYANEGPSQHVDGYVGKTGIQPFTFPIGNGEKIQPAGIEEIQEPGFFKAAYYAISPSKATLPEGAPFFTSAYDNKTLSAVHPLEYWDIDGATSTSVVLHWDKSSGFDTWLENLDFLTVAGWDGNQWMNLGRLTQEGTLEQGRITSLNVNPSDYLAYTFGKTLGWNKNFISWESTSVAQKGNQALFDWTSINKDAIEKFEVQRKTEFGGFKTIATVPANNKIGEPQTYRFKDKEISDLATDFVHYRLKTSNESGHTVYSPKITLTLNPSIEQVQLQVFPNPADEEIHLKVKNYKDDEVELQFVDIVGQPVYQKVIQGNGDYTFPSSVWKSGTYELRLVDKSGRKAQKVIIRHGEMIGN